MMTSETPSLELTDIEVYYGQARALAFKSLTVGKGEIVSLLGGNASGKSTTMKTILGIVSPRQGSIRLGGVDVTHESVASRIRNGVAVVPEARRVFPEMTVHENLAMGAFTTGRQERNATYEQVYDLFPRLVERRAQLAGTMSGGEQQMLAFGRALMSRPALLCMDEPTMGLSPLFVERVLSTIERLNQELGIAVLMVEQNAELALSIAHRGYVLRSGELALSDTAERLLGNELVREAYLGKIRGGSASAAAQRSYDDDTRQAGQ